MQPPVLKQKQTKALICPMRYILYQTPQTRKAKLDCDEVKDYWKVNHHSVPKKKFGPCPSSSPESFTKYVSTLNGLLICSN